MIIIKQDGFFKFNCNFKNSGYDENLAEHYGERWPRRSNGQHRTETEGSLITSQTFIFPQRCGKTTRGEIRAARRGLTASS
jgi:hypothetical protein